MMDRRTFFQATAAVAVTGLPREVQSDLIPTGLKSLDAALGGGVRRGSLISLAGRGKTSFFEQMATVNHGRRVHFPRRPLPYGSPGWKLTPDDSYLVPYDSELLLLDDLAINTDDDRHALYDTLRVIHRLRSSKRPPAIVVATHLRRASNGLNRGVFEPFYLSARWYTERFTSGPAHGYFGILHEWSRPSPHGGSSVVFSEEEPQHLIPWRDA